MYKVPILITVYNRPDLFKKLLTNLKKNKPSKIYIKGDGPKNEIDRKKIKSIKKIISLIDWKCKIFNNFSSVNVGCRKSVTEGLNWFFSKEKFGIILEDDCLPNVSFFRYCEILLKKFYNNKRIYTISGSNFQNHDNNKYDYYFSKYPHCWGWASWRRAWKSNDPNLSFWPKWKRTYEWNRYHKTLIEKKYWEKIFDKVYNEKIDSWAYVWTASVWKNNGITATPRISLINNIGFDNRATHTLNTQKKLKRNIKNLKFPLKHPKIIQLNKEADKYTFGSHFKGIYYLWPLRFIHLIDLFIMNPKIFIIRTYKKLLSHYV